MTRSPAGTSPPRIPFGLLLLGWLVLAAFDIGQSAIAQVAQGREFVLRTSITFTVPAYVMLAVLSPLVFAWTRRFPLEPDRMRRGMAAHAAASLVFPAVHLSLSAIAVSLLTGGQAQVLTLIQRWSFFFVAVDILRYWALVWLYQALWSTRRLHAREIEIRQLQAQAAAVHADLAEAKLEALARQLRPHFLFNALNVISGVALQQDPERAATLIARLSDLLRRSLRQTETITTLQEELEFLDAYLHIEQARLGSRLSITHDVDPGLERCRVPSFLLQPLAENAIQHGIAPSAEGGELIIRASRHEDTLCLQVEDDGRGFLDAGSHDGIGLSSTRQRLETIYGDAASLDIVSREGHGTVVTARLPVDCTAVTARSERDRARPS